MEPNTNAAIGLSADTGITNNANNTIDPGVQSALSNTGQLAPSNLRTSLFGNAFLNNVLQSASTVDVPDVQPIDFTGTPGLEPAQAAFLSSQSAAIANQQNVVNNALESQFRDSVLPSIASAAQDQAVITGQISGQLGATPDQSTRNLSVIGDAQARGIQQTTAAFNEFSNSISQAAASAQAQQTALTGQAAQFQESNRNFDFSRDQYLTEATGKLYDSISGAVGTQDTQAGELNQQQIASNYGALTAQSIQNQIANDTFQGIIDATNAQNQLATTQTAYQNEQLNILNNSFAAGTTQDLVLDEAGFTDANGILTAWSEGQTLYNGEEITPAKLEEATRVFTNVQQRFGEGALLYYNVEKDLLDPNSVPTLVATDSQIEEALTTKGMFLNNLGFDDAYNNYDDGNIRDRYRQEVVSTLQSGEGNEAFNKIVINSPDQTKTLLAINTMTPNGAQKYEYYEVDMSQANSTDRAKFIQDLNNAEANNQASLDSFVNFITTGDVGNLKVSKFDSASNFMQSFNDQVYQDENGQNRPSPYTDVMGKEFAGSGLNMRQLVSLGIAGSSGSLVNRLETNGAIDVQADGRVSITGLTGSNNDLNNLLRPSMFDNSEENVALISQMLTDGGTQLSEEQIKTRFGQAVQVEGTNYAASDGVKNLFGRLDGVVEIMSNDLKIDFNDQTDVDRLAKNIDGIIFGLTTQENINRLDRQVVEQISNVLIYNYQKKVRNSRLGEGGLAQKKVPNSRLGEGGLAQINGLGFTPGATAATTNPQPGDPGFIGPVAPPEGTPTGNTINAS